MPKLPKRQSVVQAFAKGAALGARIPGGLPDTLRKKVFALTHKLQAKEWKAAQAPGAKPVRVKPLRAKPKV
jgi:hypothetical protein